jgi:iron-sulfur cluster assembly accessory protein
MTTAVTISERAARRIGEILKTEGDGAMLRISVEGGGCSGFQYKFDVERAQAKDDIVIARDSAVVLVDPASVPFLAGSEVDFVDDLIGASFRVVNPNATASCGCGTSFSIREIFIPDAYCDVERQFHPAADRSSADLAEGLFARHRLPAGNQMRR